MTKREQRKAEKEAEEAAAKECGREAVGLIDRTMLYRLLVAGQVLLKYRVHRKRNVKRMNAQGAQVTVVEEYYEEIGAGKGDVDVEVLTDEPCYRIDPQSRYWHLVVQAIPEVMCPPAHTHLYLQTHSSVFVLIRECMESRNFMKLIVPSFASCVRSRGSPMPPMSWIC